MEDTDTESDKLFNPKPQTIDFEGYTLNDELPFRPNLTPAQVLRAGAFGGTYFRNIYSSVTKQSYKDADKEFPKSWFKGLDRKKHLVRPFSKYDKSVNKYKVKVGLKLKDWEKKKWIYAVDPYGWFQWYCRFYQGRRLHNDQENKDVDRKQIKRFNNMSRFVGSLVTMIKNKEAETGESHWNDYSVGAGYRQTLLHWGYQLTLADYNRFKREGKYKFK